MTGSPSSSGLVLNPAWRWVSIRECGEWGLALPPGVGVAEWGTVVAEATRWGGGGKGQPQWAVLNLHAGKRLVT